MAYADKENASPVELGLRPKPPNQLIIERSEENLLIPGTVFSNPKDMNKSCNWNHIQNENITMSIESIESKAFLYEKVIPKNDTEWGWHNDKGIKRVKLTSGIDQNMFFVPVNSIRARLPDNISEGNDI